MDEEWLGVWLVESIDGHSPEQHLAARLGSDRFISWEYTFFDNWTFASKLSQDTGRGILVTTILGTYRVAGNRYATETTSAAASMSTTRMPVPDVVGLNQAGTWSRAEDVLTLDPLGSSMKVLKRLWERMLLLWRELLNYLVRKENILQNEQSKLKEICELILKKSDNF